jgi:MFS family permease
MMGLIVATFLGTSLGWRGIFYITGSLGLILAVVIFFGVKDPLRGQSEPEMQDLDKIGVYKFDGKIALGLFRKKSFIFLVLQGFVGVFPWNVITYWFFRYLETERFYSADEVFITMAPAVLVLASGYFIGGALGDLAFKRSPRGRVLVALAGVILGAFSLLITMNIPIENQVFFLIMLMVTALFIPFASPNVISTVYDITLPEVRSTALAIQYFIENAGAALAPLLAGIIASNSSLHNAILIICVSAWIIDAVFFAITASLVPVDIRTLRKQMQERADLERQRDSEKQATTTI